MNEFTEDKWFEYHMGFTESCELVSKNLSLEDYPDHCELINKLNKKRYNCGKFLLRDVSSYQYLLQNDNIKRNKGHLHLIQGNGKRSSKADMIDVLQHQNNNEFEGATFLAASNFNCLEFPYSECNAELGISKYSKDQTQGPTLQTASLSSTIYRNYFVKHKKIPSICDEISYKKSVCNYFIGIDSNSNVYYNQSDDKYEIYQGQIDYELNLLERTPIPVRHGKAMLNSETNEIIHHKIFNEFDFLNENAYLIGVHQNCQVTTNRGSNCKLVDVSHENKIVHQVFAASFSLGKNVISNQKNIEIMKFMLATEYKLTILAAWENSLMFPDHVGSNKCVLTLIGAGIFFNPIEVVASAILANKDLIVKSGIDVYVTCFSGNIFKAVDNVLHDAVIETGGSFIDAR